MDFNSAPPPLPQSPPPFMPPPPPPPPLNSEIVLVVLDKIQQKTGLFSKVIYRMLVTSVRLIFALQVNNGVDYMHQEPSLTLIENPGNFSILLTDLIKITTYKGAFNDNEPDMMEVKTTTQTQKFFISNYFNVTKQLKNVLGDRVK